MVEDQLVQSARSGRRYRLGQSFHLGETLMCEALDEDHRPLWVKQVPADEEPAIARLHYEAIILNKLHHANVIRLIDRGRSRSCVFLVMEPAPGRSLCQQLEAGLLPIPQVFHIALQIADLLVYLHAQGIFCCALPPAHLYLDHMGHVTLVNLSDTRDEVAPPQQIGLEGYLAYRSLEQVSGAPVERRSDIYAYGALLFELLTGQPPFTGASRGELILHHLLTTPASPIELRADVPDEFAALVQRCLAKSPSQRYQHAATLATELRNLGNMQTNTQDSTTRQWPWLSQRISIKA